MLKKIKSRYVYLGLGSNLGNRKKNIIKSVYLLKKEKKIKSAKLSSIYKSEPWGYSNQKEFYNAVLKITTTLSPDELLKTCQRIEKRAGKRKRFKWGPRSLDIDILIYNSLKIRKKRLTIPHKYITQRLFTVVPLAELDSSIRLNGHKLDYFISRLDGNLKLVDD